MSKLKFIFPIDGDCINERDGRRSSVGITIPVRISAPEGRDITVNGISAEYSNGEYIAEVTLNGWRNNICAISRTDGERSEISVFVLHDACNKYRISSDDNILFLADITKNKDTYSSIFDNPYLAVYKKAHDLYGAAVHLNLFFAHIPENNFSSHREYFDLTMMTDKFKDEFINNSHWLKLSFHAYSEFPDMPYKNTAPEVILEHAVKANREIVRFAGKETLSDVLTVHWGEASRDSVAALRSLGVRALAGYFTRTQNGDPLVAYYTDGELLDHLDERDFFYVKEYGVFFGRIDRVVNIGSLPEVMADVKALADDRTRGGFIEIMIHEQYFYSDYKNYLPDFEERVLEPSKYLYNNGYDGMLLSDAIREKPISLRV